jgi:hypothetical protein
MFDLFVEGTRAYQAQLKNNRWVTSVLVLFAVLLVVGGVYQGARIARLEASGSRAPGEIIRLDEESRSDSSSYYPIVRFSTGSNTSVEFRDDAGSNPPLYQPGDKVTVLYLPGNPQSTAIIDRGLWWNWTIPVIALAFATLLLCILGTTVLRGTQSARNPAG